MEENIVVMKCGQLTIHYNKDKKMQPLTIHYNKDKKKKPSSRVIGRLCVPKVGTR